MSSKSTAQASSLSSFSSATGSSHCKRPSINSQSFAVSGIDISEHDESDERNNSNSNDNNNDNKSNQEDLDTESVSSYGASSDAADSNDELHNFNSVDYLYNTLNNAINNNNSILDRALVTQAQTSGILKAKSVELNNLEKEVAQKLEQLRINIDGENGSKDSFKEIFHNCQKNLIWCEKHLATLTEKVNIEYPIEYNESKDQVLSRSNFNINDERDLEFLNKGNT